MTVTDKEQTTKEQTTEEPATKRKPPITKVAEPSEADTARDGSPAPRPGRAGAVSGLLFWVALGLGIALLNDSSRAWIHHNWAWFSPAAGVTILIAIVGLLAVWAKTKSAPLRAAVYLLVVFPAVALGTAGIFWMPTAGQLVALRAVVLCVLVFTPALMWWLFIATQRASLLNEFIANLDRLGLLEKADAAESNESDSARETRISSYLQKFEATYGGLPRKICHDVVEGEFRSYSSEEARDRTSLTAAAVPVTLTLVTLLVGWSRVMIRTCGWPSVG